MEGKKTIILWNNFVYRRHILCRYYLVLLFTDINCTHWNNFFLKWQYVWFLAAEKGNAEQAYLLLNHGANVYCRTYDNKRPMDKAIISNSPSIVASILQSEAFVVTSRYHVLAFIKNIKETTKHVRSECLKCLLEHIINTSEK